MTAIVPHHRPQVDAETTIRSALPVSAGDWGGLAALANWLNGHGRQVVPWTSVGESIAPAASRNFYVRMVPKLSCVERVWAVVARWSTAPGDDAYVDVSVGGGTAVTHSVTISRDDRRGAIIFREQLSSQSSSVAETYLTLAVTKGTLVVESFACFEQTRGELADSTDDYAADASTCLPRQPIADFDYQSIPGVAEAYLQVDARRILFAWSVSETEAITPGSTSATDLFELDPPMHAAIYEVGDTVAEITVAVRAKVDTGTGVVTVNLTSGDTVSINVTATSYAWVTGTVDVATEDLTIADGRRGNAWELAQIQGADPAGGQLDITSILIYRATTPI